MKTFLRQFLFIGWLGALSTGVQATDLTNGVMSAVPVKGGHAPKIDGDLSDFDLSGAEPI